MYMYTCFKVDLSVKITGRPMTLTSALQHVQGLQLRQPVDSQPLREVQEEDALLPDGHPPINRGQGRQAHETGCGAVLSAVVLEQRLTV